jgi:hypothetical protein
MPSFVFSLRQKQMSPQSSIIIIIVETMDVEYSAE